MFGKVRLQHIHSFSARRTLFKLTSWFTLFFLICGFSMARNGLTAEFYGVRLTSPADDLKVTWLVGPDWGSYFQAGYSWWDDGVLTDPGVWWITNLWPPGMPGLHMIMLAVSSGRSPLLILAILTCALWSLVFALGMYRCQTGISRFFCLLLVLILLMTPAFSYYIFGINFALPTGFATALTILAIQLAALLKSLKTSWQLIISAIIGICLSVAALFRVSSYWAANILAVITLLVVLRLIVIQSMIHFGIRRNQAHVISMTRLRVAAICLLPMSLIPLATTQTWTSVVTTRVHPENRSFTTTVPELAYGQVWRTDDDLAVCCAWVLPYSINWACRINATRCQEIHQVESTVDRPFSGAGTPSKELLKSGIMTAISKPHAYILERAGPAWRSWSLGNPVLGVFLIISSAVAIILSACLARRGDRIDALLFLLFVLTATLPMLWILLFPYYFIPLQVASVMFLASSQTELKFVIEASRNALRRLQSHLITG